jgi:hypothetical protein
VCVHEARLQGKQGKGRLGARISTMTHAKGLRTALSHQRYSGTCMHR